LIEQAYKQTRVKNNREVFEFLMSLIINN